MGRLIHHDYSQHGQPYFFRQFLPPHVPRWVVDVGANDGIEGSNSREFLDRGWQGVLIEPLPSAFEALTRNTRPFPGVHLVRCACGAQTRREELFIGADLHGQMSSLAADRNRQRFLSGEKIEVQVRRLTDILAENDCPCSFALLLIDAEGWDYEVLAGLDLERYRPAVICSEISTLTWTDEARKATLLTKSGYQLRGTSGWDTVWTCSQQVGNRSWPDSFQPAPPELQNRPLGLSEARLDEIASLANGHIGLRGWAAARDRSIPSRLALRIRFQDGEEDSRALPRQRRADVAEHFRSEAMLWSGFFGSFFAPNWLEVACVEVLQADEQYAYVDSFQLQRPLPRLRPDLTT